MILQYKFTNHRIIDIDNYLAKSIHMVIKLSCNMQLIIAPGQTSIED